MATIWITSEDPVLPRTLAFHLGVFGEVWTGPPERSHWKDLGAPDLLVVIPADAPNRGPDELERTLAFVRAIPRQRTAPPPVVYVEPTSGHPSGALARSLIDDRPLVVMTWPLDPEALAGEAASLLERSALLPSLRERSRRDWVTRRVELFYAGMDMPELRQAIDPRNAPHPLLLVGEPGTGRGLLAHYIHNLAEPVRALLVTVPASSLEPGRIEAQLLGPTSGRRSTLYLEGLDAASAAVQEELADLLGQSGLLGVDSIRWIASAATERRVDASLRRLPWHRVTLPPLRERSDLAVLARELARGWAERSGRAAELAPDALDLLAQHAWPGNLRELEAAITASLTAAGGGVIDASKVRIPVRALGARPRAPAPPPLDARQEAAEPAVTLEEVPAPPPTEKAPEAPPVEAAPEPAPVEAAPEVETAAPEPRPEPARPEGLPEGITVQEELSIRPVEGPPAEAEAAARGEPGVLELIAPLAQEIRQPLVAIRTYAALLDQRPEDPGLRQELASLVDGDLGRLEETLYRIERFARFGHPRRDEVNLSALAASELDRRQTRLREREIVVLRELETRSPFAIADEEQLRFALGGLLDRALRMMPPGADLYVGTRHRRGRTEEPARQRLLIRFHSPEDVLVSPDDVSGPSMAIEVLLARALVRRMRGVLAVDVAGTQDNVVLIELPA